MWRGGTDGALKPGRGGQRRPQLRLLTPCLSAALICCAGIDRLQFSLPGPLRPSAAAPQPAAGRSGGLKVGRRFFNLFGGDGGEKEPVPETPTPSEPLPGAGPFAPEGFDSEERALSILHYPHPALRAENAPVTEFDGRLRVLVDNLFRTMYATGNGIGLAAPQVGVNLRVLVYNPEPMTTEEEVIFINPQVVEWGGARENENESCLSFPRMRGPVKRFAWVKVKAMDWDGCPFERTIEGFEARVFQHEYDHLKGTLYIDHLADSWKSAVSPDINFLTEDYARNGGVDPAL